MKTWPQEPIHPDKDYYNVPCLGLTKREYFAIKILEGLIAGGRASGGIKEITSSSIIIADAFISELNKNDDGK